MMEGLNIIKKATYNNLLPLFKPLRMTCFFLFVFFTLTSHAVARAFKYVDRLVVT